MVVQFGVKHCGGNFLSEEDGGISAQAKDINRWD